MTQPEGVETEPGTGHDDEREVAFGLKSGVGGEERPSKRRVRSRLLLVP